MEENWRKFKIQFQQFYSTTLQTLDLRKKQQQIKKNRF